MASLRPLSALPVVGVLVDGRTYRHLLYLLLAIPLGLVYSALFSFGFAFGIALSLVLVGVVILVATLIGARIAAGFERWLANRLLGTDLERYDDVPADANGAVAGVRKYVDAASTWRGVGFLSLKFFVTVIAIVPLSALANGLSLTLAPARYPYAAEFGESNGEPVTWAIETFPESLLAAAIGVVAVLAALHVTNLVAYVSRQVATALLGESASAETVPLGDSPPPEPDEFIPADAVEPGADRSRANDPDTDRSDLDADPGQKGDDS